MLFAIESTLNCCSKDKDDCSEKRVECKYCKKTPSYIYIYIYVFFPSSMCSRWLLRGDMTYNNEAVVCFSLCYITNHTMTSPSGNSSFCFSRMSMFPSAGLRGTKWTVSLRTSHSVFNKCIGWTGLSSSAKNPATNWIWSICPVIRQYYYGVVIFPLLKLTSQ